MRYILLGALTLLLATNGDAREHWGPPPACPKPKADCCPKPCPPKPCKPKSRSFYKATKNPVCKPKCDPCGPPESCNPCCPERCVDLEPGYNSCAAIDIDCGWNVWIDGSFTYWEAMQDNMEFAMAHSGDPAVVPQNVNGNISQMDFEYKPGFKVGLGITSNYDCWDFFAEYTWFRSTVSQSVTAPTPGTILPTTGVYQVSGGGPFNAASSSWHSTLDILDGRMGRWHYVGKQLTFHPYFGLRAAWISQDWSTVYSTDTVTFLAEQQLKSWGVGPQVGVDTHWNFCYGFRIYGQAEADILFTRYTTQRTYNQNISANRVWDISEDGNNTLRAHLDLELGLGWGTYLNCYKWYFDLAAGYGFQVFFDQNMFREYQSTAAYSSVYGGNLYLHGLTITAKLEF